MFILTTKLACHNARILNVYEFKHVLLWYFRQAYFVRFVFKPKKFCEPEDSRNIPMGKNESSYELPFWFISDENSGKQKRKNTLSLNAIS